MLRECKHCEDEFDCQSAEKKRVGGYINECPDCVEELGTETHVRYRVVCQVSPSKPVYPYYPLSLRMMLTLIRRSGRLIVVGITNEREV